MNCGRNKYFGGEIIEQYTPSCGREAKRFATRVREIDLQDCGLVLKQDKTDSYLSTQKEDQGIGGMTQ